MKLFEQQGSDAAWRYVRAAFFFRERFRWGLLRWPSKAVVGPMVFRY